MTRRAIGWSRRTRLRPDVAARLAGTSAVVLALGLGSTSVAAQSLRYATIAPGGIASTGNTLGLAKASDQNGPGAEHSIGTFISLERGCSDDVPRNLTNPWPPGTTWDWRQSGSTGVLSLPAEAEVLHAELVWAGSYDYGAEDVSPWLDDAIALISGHAQVWIEPDPATALTLAEQSHTGFAANYYLRSADVTDFVSQYGGGTYSVSGVPATQGDYTNTLSGAGWSLVVAYRHDDQPIRNLSIFVGGSFVDEDSRQDYTVSGFCAPPAGLVEGNVTISALEGDANLTGDELSIGGTSGGDFVSLFGPNNPGQNFFCSQINDAAGYLDPSGSFGDANHDAHAGQNAAGARQGWDLTTLPLTSERGHLDNDQTSAVLRTTTTGDSFVPVVVALEIDVKAPDFGDSLTEASEEVVEVGDQLVVTTTLRNAGQARAKDLLLVLPIDAGLSLTSFTMDGQPGDAAGEEVGAADLATGVDAGTLRVAETRTVELVLEVLGPPHDEDRFVFAPRWAHRFTMCRGDEPIEEFFAGPQDTVQYHEEPVLPAGGQGGGDAGRGGARPALGDDVQQTGGCQCAALGGAGSVGSGLRRLVLLVLGALRALGRRRRGIGATDS